MSRTQQLPNTMAAQTETYEALDLGQLNPRCPYFHSLGQALWFTGELIDSDLVIHPASHELGRKLLESPQLKPLEEVFQSWLTEFELPGARPYAHGSASVVLEVGLDTIIKLSDAGKQKAPTLPFVLTPLREKEIGEFRLSLEERLEPAHPSEAELASLALMAEANGYCLEDAFTGNFGRNKQGQLLIVDSDAIKLIGS